MLEFYLDEKVHLSSEIRVVEVEKVVISFPYVIYIGNLLGNPGKSHFEKCHRKNFQEKNVFQILFSLFLFLLYLMP